MKKKIFYLVALTFFLSGSSQTKSSDWSKRDSEKMTKEEKAEQKRIEKEALKQKKEAEKRAKSAEREARKREKELEKERRKVEREAERRREEADREIKKAERAAEKKRKKIDKQHHDEEKMLQKQRAEKEHRLKKEKKNSLWAFNNSDEGKKLKKEERKAKELEKQRREAEKNEKKRLEKEAKKQRKKEESKIKKEKHKDELKLAKQEYDQKMQQRYDQVRHNRKKRNDLIQKWALYHNKEVVESYAQGKYAELYKSPAWPTHAQYYENNHYLNIEACYNYATDSYDSSGASSNSDVSRLAFGEDEIRFKDISLVSKLISQKKLVAANANNIVGQLTVNDGADRVIKFNGQVESYGIKIDLSRYIFRNNIAAGVQIPILYKKNRLRFNFPFNFASKNDAGQTIEESRDAQLGLIFRRLLESKCFEVNCKNLKTIGNSATGIGDIAAFINGQVDSTYFEKLVFGLRVQFPTAKKAKQHKLWSPELGNGGSTDFTGYLGTHIAYKKYLNPHILIQGTFSTDAHVDRRVPKRFTLDDVTATGIVKSLSRNQKCPFEKLAFADRVRFAQAGGTTQSTGNNAQTFDEFDTCIKGFADNIKEVEFTRGPELNVRLGNIFERFITHRGFLDMFYDLRVKARDEYRGLCEDEWNLALLRVHTQEIEHRLGFDFSHQFDWDTRLRCGMRYTFAGMNVPKTFTLTGSMSHTF